jgi:hypothetical protein
MFVLGERERESACTELEPQLKESAMKRETLEAVIANLSLGQEKEVKRMAESKRSRGFDCCQTLYFRWKIFFSGKQVEAQQLYSKVEPVAGSISLRKRSLKRWLRAPESIASDKDVSRKER